MSRNLIGKYVDDLWWASIRLEDYIKRRAVVVGTERAAHVISGFTSSCPRCYFFRLSLILYLCLFFFPSSSFSLPFLLLYSLAEIMFFSSVDNIFLLF